jgi:hypothetical protein
MGCHVCKSANTVSNNFNNHISQYNTESIAPKKSMNSRRGTSLSYKTGHNFSNSLHVQANHFIRFKQQPIQQDYTLSRQSNGNGLIKAIQKETGNMRSIKVLPKSLDTPIT